VVRERGPPMEKGLKVSRKEAKREKRGDRKKKSRPGELPKIVGTTGRDLKDMRINGVCKSMVWDNHCSWGRDWATEKAVHIWRGH